MNLFFEKEQQIIVFHPLKVSGESNIDIYQYDATRQELSIDRRSIDFWEYELGNSQSNKVVFTLNGEVAEKTFKALEASADMLNVDKLISQIEGMKPIRDAENTLQDIAVACQLEELRLKTDAVKRKLDILKKFDLDGYERFLAQQSGQYVDHRSQPEASNLIFQPKGKKFN